MRRNLAAWLALLSPVRRNRSGAVERNGMREAGLQGRRVAARPDWLPHPALLQFVGALWIAVAALRLLTGPHA
ncbi:MAG: hypothetical protein WDM86_12495 [Rhizomicrobium sp.]